MSMIVEGVNKMLNNLWIAYLLLGLLAGCASERRVSHAEMMDALGQMTGKSASEAEALLNRNLSRQRRQEQDMARQKALSDEQTKREIQQQQIELQYKINQMAAAQANSAVTLETNQQVRPSSNPTPTTKSMSLCPNQSKVDISRKSKHGSAVCVE